jgi:integrase
MKRPYPHLFRHSLTTWLIIRGVQPKQIAEIVGHENTRMIDEGYSHLVPANAYDAMAGLFKSKRTARVLHRNSWRLGSGRVPKLSGVEQTTEFRYDHRR